MGPLTKRYGGVAAYGAASRYMPGTTTTGTMAAGAIAGGSLASVAYGETYGRMRDTRTAMGRFGGRSAQVGSFLSGRRLARGGAAKLGGGIAGAIGGYALARASRALFGKSNNRSTSMRSNYGYR